MATEATITLKSSPASGAAAHHVSPSQDATLTLPNQLLLVFQVVSCKGQHSISYTLSRNHTVVVEYSHDKDTDMFQVTPPLASPLSCHRATSCRLQMGDDHVSEDCAN